MATLSARGDYTRRMGETMYGPMTEADLPAAVRMIVHAFAGTEEGTRDWLRAAGMKSVRVVREHGKPGAAAGCLLRIPMGQYFGGRSVSMLGIAGVAVAPEARGRGLAEGGG